MAPKSGLTAHIEKPKISLDFIQEGVLFDTKVNDPSIPSIPEFFRGRDIFITGGSGFMGRVLIEKLLRSCPDLNQLFILMREKRGKGIPERLEDLKNLPVQYFITLFLSQIRFVPLFVRKRRNIKLFSH